MTGQQKTRKIIIYFTIVVLILAVGFGAGFAVHKVIAPGVDDQAVVDDLGSGPENTSEPQGENVENSGASASPSQAPTQTPTQGKPTYLRANEVTVNGLGDGITSEQLIAKLGQPKNVEHLGDDETDKIDVYDYGNIKYYYCYYGGVAPQGVSYISIVGKVNQAPRNIQVGDKFKDVLNKFPQEKDYKTSEDGSFYGTVMHGSTNYGFVSEEAGNQMITVVSEDPWSNFMIIYFMNGLVKEISLVYVTN